MESCCRLRYPNMTAGLCLVSTYSKKTKRYAISSFLRLFTGCANCVDTVLDMVSLGKSHYEMPVPNLRLRMPGAAQEMQSLHASVAEPQLPNRDTHTAPFRATLRSNAAGKTSRAASLRRSVSRNLGIQSSLNITNPGITNFAI